MTDMFLQHSERNNSIPLVGHALADVYRAALSGCRVRQDSS